MISLDFIDLDGVKLDEYVQLLEIRFAKINFLINKYEISNSITITDEKPFLSNLKYFHSLAVFQKQILPIFDLKSYLNDTFPIKENGQKSIILIIEIQKLSDKNKKYLNSFYKKNKLQNVFSNDFLAVKIYGEFSFKKYPFNDIQLLPVNLIQLLMNQGISGVHFKENKIFYFLDLGNLIFTKLIRMKKNTIR